MIKLLLVCLNFSCYLDITCIFLLMMFNISISYWVQSAPPIVCFSSYQDSCHAYTAEEFVKTSTISLLFHLSVIICSASTHHSPCYGEIMLNISLQGCYFTFMTKYFLILRIHNMTYSRMSQKCWLKQKPKLSIFCSSAYQNSAPLPQSGQNLAEGGAYCAPL